MSEKGKRARLADGQDKRENAQVNKIIKMSDKDIFVCEIVVNAGERDSNDEIGYYMKLEQDEAVPENAKGCYIPSDENENSVKKRIENMEKRMYEQGKIIDQQQKDLKAVELFMTKQRIKEAKNQVAQLGKGLEAAVVLLKFPNWVKRFKDRYPSFWKVLNADSKVISDEEKSDFMNFPLYISVNNVTGTGTLFEKVVQSRNSDAHPDRIEIHIHQLKDDLDAINMHEALSPYDIDILQKTRDSFKKLNDIEGIESLVNEYNNNRFYK